MSFHSKERRERVMRKANCFFVAITIIAMLSAGMLSPPSAVAKAKVIHLALGSTSSTSGVYAFAVAIAAAVNKYDPGIVVTVVESGGGIDNVRRMKEGVFDWSAGSSPSLYAQVTEGLGGFKKEGPWEPPRLMFMRTVNASRVYVRADIAKREGIKTFSDLAGKKFAPGIPGTRDMTRAMDVDKYLGIRINFVPGSLADSIRTLKEGRVVGLLKGSPSDRFDAAMLECHYTTPLTVIGFTKEQADKIQENDPLNTLMETPAGAIKELPKLGSLWEMNSAIMTMSDSRMSQEVGYRIMKAVHKGWDEIGAAYSPCKGVKPIADAFKYTPPVTPSGKPYLFHAGIIQYAREIGIEVPKRLIPPEYKAPK